VKIETEYFELMNQLALSDEEVENTNMLEIKRFIKKLKPQNQPVSI